jgi:ubiquinone/menaquinone biosynthesis C-methylase UbiE
METPTKSRYPLGHSPEELNRLMAQARSLATHTTLLLRYAGVLPGQRVLDIGCGTGDVSFIAAQFVGETGHVLGIDRSPEAIAMARERARRSGHTNVEFLVEDVTNPDVPGRFDAIVGRLVLMYLQDPVAVLARLRPLLRLQGLVVMQEGDLPTIASEPECPLVSEVRNWMITGLERSGCATRMGSRLCSVMFQAGYKPEGSWVSQPSLVGPHLTQMDWFTETMQALLPVLQSLGIANTEDLELETLTARLQADARVRDAIVYLPRLTGVWARNWPR